MPVQPARLAGLGSILEILIGMAKLNNFDPEGYLREVLTRIADHRINRIADLLPRNIATQPQVSI